MKIATWIENNRDGISSVLNAISTVVWLASLLAVRTAAGAGATLMYLFFNVAPETTLYQLSQTAHSAVFWQCALCIAVIYSAFVMSIHGSINSKDRAASFGEAAGVCGVAKHSVSVSAVNHGTAATETHHDQ